MEQRIPLAAKLRPSSLSDMVGQDHLIGEGRPLRRIIESGMIPNMIFYGSSGLGKTTLAQIIAASAEKTLYKLNATTASTAADSAGIYRKREDYADCLDNGKSLFLCV